jgi:putative MATE family efflux protein
MRTRDGEPVDPTDGRPSRGRELTGTEVPAADELIADEAASANEEVDQPTTGGSRDGPRRFDRDLTQGSILGNLWTLAWPTTVSGSIAMLGPTIDMIWVGSLGSAALAGVGVSGIAVMMVNSAKMGLNTGTRALLARAVGASNLAEANQVAQQAIVIAILFSLILAAIGIFFAESILVLMGLEPDVIREGADYMRIMFVGSICMSMSMMANSAMQAAGDAINPMKITMGTRAFHVVLCPFLIFGWGIFPELGVKGAALTNVISQGAAMTIMFWMLFTGRTRLHLSLKGFGFDPGMIWRIVKIGIPASITGMERSLANFVMMMFIVKFGTAAVAAHTLAQRVDMLVHMPGQGFGQAAGVLAAQNLGAGKTDRAERTAWTAVAFFTAIMAVASTLIWFFAEYAVMIFNREPELVEIAATFLRIDIVSYMVFGIVIVLVSCLNGVGDTMVTMVVTLITLWAVQIPLAWLLPQVTDLGVYGVRWAVIAALLLRTVVYTAYFRRGRWKRIRV